MNEEIDSGNGNDASIDLSRTECSGVEGEGEKRRNEVTLRGIEFWMCACTQRARVVYPSISGSSGSIFELWSDVRKREVVRTFSITDLGEDLRTTVGDPSLSLSLSLFLSLSTSRGRLCKPRWRLRMRDSEGWLSGEDGEIPKNNR